MIRSEDCTDPQVPHSFTPVTIRFWSAGSNLDSELLRALVRSVTRATHELRYSKAAITSSERIPVHSDMDSSIPPIIAPMRFEPNAWARKPSAAKLRMSTTPRSEEHTSELQS